MKGGPEIIPRDLFTSITADYSKAKFINPWNYPQHGKDYGNPRPGYDLFQLMFLAMQKQEAAAKKEVVKSKICYNDDEGEQHCASGNRGGD